MASDKCFSFLTRRAFPPLAFKLFFTQTAFNLSIYFSRSVQKIFNHRLPPCPSPSVQARVKGETICLFFHSPLGQPLVPACFQSLGTVNCTCTSTTSPLSRKRRLFMVPREFQFHATGLVLEGQSRHYQHPSNFPFDQVSSRFS